MTRPPPAAVTWGLLLVSMAVPVSAAVAQPAQAPPASAASVLDQPVRYGTSATPAGRPATAPPADPSSDLWHVLAALALVVALIFALRWAARKMSLVPDLGRAGKGVRLLSRTVLAPKQQVMLIQVGRRVVVVGDSGAAGMRPLAEITDPDEVAALIGEVRSAAADPAPAKSFGNLFRRAAEPYDADPPPSTSAPPSSPDRPSADADLPGEVAGLLNKVRGMRQQFDR